jgi:hypothetical protein
MFAMWGPISDFARIEPLLLIGDCLPNWLAEFAGDAVRHRRA